MPASDGTLVPVVQGPYAYSKYVGAILELTFDDAGNLLVMQARHNFLLDGKC